MTTPPNVIILLGLAAIAAGIGDEVARQTSRRLGWLAAGPFVLLAASPLVPNYSIALGFSLDDALPLLGLLMMLPLVPWGRLRATYWAPTPDSDLRSASGIPSRSNVRLMSSGTSSHERPSFSDGFT